MITEAQHKTITFALTIGLVINRFHGYTFDEFDKALEAIDNVTSDNIGIIKEALNLAISFNLHHGYNFGGDICDAVDALLEVEKGV